MRHPWFCALLVVASSCATADWTLVNEQSTLSFISIKKENVAEVHTFKQLEGSLTADGAVALEIDLNSMETNVPIRNERMRTLLFETTKFPSAKLTAKLDSSVMNALQTGTPQEISTEASLNLHGLTQKVNIQALAVRANDQTIVVANRTPIIIAADNFALGPGVEKLREVVNLPSISHAVPVSFLLTFQQ